MGYKFNPFTGNFDIDNVGTGGTAAGDGLNRISAGTQIAGTNASVVFSNSNNVSFGMSNSSIVTASASFNQTVDTNKAGTGFTSASTAGSDLAGTLNTNGLSVGVPKWLTTAQPVGAYLTTAAQSNQVVNSINGSTGEFTFNTGSSLSSSRNANSITFGLASNITTALQSAGAYLTTAMQSNAVTLSNIKVSGGTTSNNLSAITFADSNGVSFGLNASTLTATVKTDYQSSNANYLTSQSNQALSGSNGSFNFQTATFGNLNGMSFYTSNGSMVGSYTVPTVTDYFSKTNTTFNGANVSGSLTLNTNGLQVSLSAAAPGGGGAALKGSGTYTQNTGTIEFANSNGITFGLSNNGTMTASHNGLTQQSTQPVALSGSNGSFNFSTASFGNSNGMSFYSTNGSLVGSYTVPTVTNSSLTVQAGASTLSSVSRMAFVDSNGVSFGASTSNNGSVSITASHNGLTSQSNQAASASNGSFTFQTLNFSNANNVTFGTSAGGIMTASVAAPGAAAENNWFNLTGNTAGNTSASGSTIMLSATGNVTISGTNGSQIVISGGAGGGGATLRDWDNMGVIGSMNQISNITATIFSRGRPLLTPIQLDGYMSFNRLRFEMSRATNGSNSFTVNFGLYSFSNSTRLDLIGSFQNVFAGTATASMSGIRRFELTHANTDMTYLAPGHYVGALGFSANGDATVSMNYSLRGGLTANPPVGLIGAGTDANSTANLSSIHLREFRGLWSTTTAAMPSAISKADVQGWTTGGHPYIWMGSR